MTDARRIQVVLLTDARPVAPGSCPACGWRLADFGCRLEAAWLFGPEVQRRTQIRVIYIVECQGPVDPTTLIPWSGCPTPGGADLPHG